MKVKPIYIIVLLALALTYALCDGRKIRDKASIVIGRFEEASKADKALIADLNKDRAEQNKVIASKTAEIASILANAGKPTQAEKDKDKVIVAQQKKIVALEAQGDLAGALEASKAESRAWSEKFQLAQEEHGAEMAELNAAWQVKFDAQIQIADAWKAQYESEHHLRLLAEEGWNVTSRQLQRTRIVSNIEKVVLIGFGGVVLYKTIKGK